MISAVTTIHVLVAFVLMISVLLQTGKGAGLGAAFGGTSSSVFGARGPASLIGKVTTVAAIIFMTTSFVLAMYARGGPGRTLELPEELPTAAQAAPGPAVPENVAPSVLGTPPAADGSQAAPQEGAAQAAPAAQAAEGAPAEAKDGQDQAAPAAGEAQPASGEAPPASDQATPASGDAPPASADTAPASADAEPASGDGPAATESPAAPGKAPAKDAKGGK